MEAQVINSSSNELSISISEADIGILYLVQHELLKDSGIDFAGVIVKHPLTKEYWMKVNSSKNNPLKEITKATESAIKTAENIKKLFQSKLR
ncbi:MAG: RpoL/Rpb11 RNA polymerase subunit family protein [Nitrosopumilaceae archaeon]|jgi:DNA-directed RNA polymerase subunit L